MKLPLISALLVLICFAGACSETNKQSVSQVGATETVVPIPELDQAQAISLAEQFIAQNGYTDLQPDRERFAYERIEGEWNVDETLRMRHDTLERSAYGISHGRKGVSSGWTVAFRYKHPSYRAMRENGRAVTMNLDGSDIRIEHVDFILRMVEKRL